MEEAVLINTSGGIAGGDRLDTAVTALAGAHITLTPRAAERIYRSGPAVAHRPR
jgi:urease accessory protein